MVVGYWVLGIGYWLLAIGCWTLAIGCWLQAVGIKLQFMNHFNTGNMGNTNKPLVIFFVLAFVIAWSLMGLAIVNHYGLVDFAPPVEPFLILGSWVPNLAAFMVVAWVLKRKGGIRKLFLGWTQYRVAPQWYLVILSPVFIGILTILFFHRIYGYSPIAETLLDPASLVAILVFTTITGAMGEELGWRGFALPWLQTRFSALGASLVLGVLWSLWHLPLWFAGLGFEVIPYWAYFLVGVSFTVLATWVCNNTRGSLLMASLFHLTLNVSVNMFDSRAFPLHAMLFILYAGIVTLVAGPRHLSRKGAPPINESDKTWETGSLK